MSTEMFGAKVLGCGMAFYAGVCNFRNHFLCGFTPPTECYFGGTGGSAVIIRAEKFKIILIVCWQFCGNSLLMRKSTLFTKQVHFYAYTIQIKPKPYLLSHDRNTVHLAPLSHSRYSLDSPPPPPRMLR